MSPEEFGQRMVELMPRLMRGIARHESNYLSKGKITLPQMWVLEHLSRSNRCPMNELARSFGISRPAATGLMDRLIAQGLAIRADDPKDRRVVRVSITPKGKRIVSNVWEEKRRTFSKVFGKISANDRTAYLKILERVVETLVD